MNRDASSNALFEKAFFRAKTEALFPVCFLTLCDCVRVSACLEDRKNNGNRVIHCLLHDVHGCCC